MGGKENSTLPTCGIHVLFITLEPDAAERDVLFAGFYNRISLSFSFSRSLLIEDRGPQVYLRRDCSRYKIIMGPVCYVNAQLYFFLNVFDSDGFSVTTLYTVLVFGGLRNLQRKISHRIVSWRFK